MHMTENFAMGFVEQCLESGLNEAATAVLLEQHMNEKEEE